MATSDHSVKFAGGVLGRKRHICAFFNSTDEEHRVLRSYIKDGLDRGEKGLHIVDPELREEHLKRLTDAGIDVEQTIAVSGQCYRCGCGRTPISATIRFDQDAMLALVEGSASGGAMQKATPLTRLLAHMEWALLDKPGVDDLLEYETRVNYLLPKFDDPGDLCVPSAEVSVRMW